MCSDGKVIVAGRQWRLMWEDGQTGIYQFKSTAATSVQKTTQLADSHRDDPQLTHDLPDRIAQHAVNKVVVQQGARAIVNAIKVPSASALLGLATCLPESGGAPSAAAVTDHDGWETASVRLGRRPHQALEGGGPGADAAVDALDVHRQSGATAVPDDEHSVYASNNIWDKFTALQPTPAAPKNSAKAKPKPNAKGHARAKQAAAGKAKAKQSNRKRTHAHADEDAPAEEPKTSRTSGMATLNPAVSAVAKADVEDNDKDQDKTSCSMTRYMAEADEKWSQDMTSVIEQTLRIVPRAEDEHFRSDMAEVATNLSSHLTEVRSRKRVVKRRTAENSEQAMNVLESMEELIVGVIAFLKAVKQNTMSGDELFQSITAFQSNSICKATFGLAVITKTLKALLLDDLKWQRWPQMITTSFHFAQKAGRLAPDRPEDCEQAYFLGGCLSQQLCVVLGKLLKSIAADAVTRQEYVVHFTFTITNPESSDLAMSLNH